MATAFEGWLDHWNGWAQTELDPNAMRGSASLKITADGSLLQSQLDGPQGSASFVLNATGDLRGAQTSTSSGGGVFRDPSLTSLFSLEPANEYDSEADLQLQIQQEDEALFMVIAQLTVNGVFT